LFLPRSVSENRDFARPFRPAFVFKAGTHIGYCLMALSKVRRLLLRYVHSRRC
jgi:hypothetical protein